MRTAHYFLLSIFLLAFCKRSVAGNDGEFPVAQKGILDLRNVDLSKNTISLHGEWGFFWKELIGPDSPSGVKIIPSSYIQFPVLWNNTVYNGHKFTSKGYATYTLTVLLPKNRRSLALKVPDVYTSYRLYVNNRLLATNGKPGISRKTTYPHWMNLTTTLPFRSDTLNLILQIANFSHSKGGPYKEIQIGDRDVLKLQQNKSFASDFLLTGCLIMGGLFFFALYLFGENDKAVLYFSLFCLVYSYRIVGADPYSLHTFYPDLPWWLMVHFEYLSLFLSLLFFLLYIKYLFAHDINRIIVNIMAYICLCFVLITLCFPPDVFTILINPFLILAFIYIGYTFYVCINAAKNKRSGAFYALTSNVVMLSVATIINLRYFGIINPANKIIFFGYVLFFFLQSLALVFRFSNSLKQAKLQAEQGLMAKSRFLSTMSHEIRTPLNSVIGMANLMLKSNPGEDQKENLNVMLFSANNLLALVNDILDYNKIEAGKITFENIETDLVQIAKKIIEGFKSSADEKGIALQSKIDKQLNVKVIADPTRISQVMYNLVQNAIKFTNEGSVLLSLVIDHKTADSITVTIGVKDTGIGIDSEKQKIIFDRFTQADSSTSRSFGGTGLGLSICKSILEHQGSRLRLQSTPGKGSFFYFTLRFPVFKTLFKENQNTPATGKFQDNDFNNVTILIVEDNEFNILVARKFLQNRGAIVEIARTGLEAFDKCKTGKYNLILMDLHMPIMDGYEATRKIRQSGIDIPIIALTASMYADDNKKVFECGINDIILKPFDPNVFYNTILHNINQHYHKQFGLLSLPRNKLT